MDRRRKIVHGTAIPPFLGNIATNLGKHMVQEAAKAFKRNVNADTITKAVHNMVRKIASKIKGKGVYKGRRTQRGRGVYKGRRMQRGRGVYKGHRTQRSGRRKSR